MLTLKRNHTVPDNGARNKASKLAGNGRQRDYTAYDLVGKGTYTNLLNQKSDELCRHVLSSGTEAQQIRLLAQMKRLAAELAVATEPARIVKLNGLLDVAHARVKELQAIVARRKVSHNSATK